MYTNNLSKYNQEYYDDFAEDHEDRNRGYPAQGGTAGLKQHKYPENVEENYEPDIHSERMDQNHLDMQHRESLGFERKINQREKGMDHNSPLYEKESFRQIKQDFQNNRLNLNEKAQLYSPDAKKIQNGVPLKFLTSDSHGNITLTRESIAELQKYRGKISFVAIAGDPKSGKTFLMNSLMGLENNKFEPDSARLSRPNPVVFLWSTPMYFPNEDKHMFFIDTQGLEKAENHGNTVGQKMFTIITLISSCLLYNVCGELNESSIKRLYMLATLPGSMTLSSSNFQITDGDIIDEKIAQFLPRLMILLRDVNQDGNEKPKEKLRRISSKDAMENLIHDFSRTKNDLTFKIKKTIGTLFKERDCLAFPKANKGSIQHLNYNIEQMNQEFFNSLMSLREKIDKDVHEKVYFHTFLNARMVTSLMQSFVDISNQNGVIDLNIAWENAVENEFINSYNDSVHNYHEKMKGFVDEDRIPTSVEMKRFVRQLRDEIIEMFDQSLKLRTHSTEKKFREYKNKLIQYLDQKEEIALNLSPGEDNTEAIDEQIIQMLEVMTENVKAESYDENKIEEFISELNFILENIVNSKDKSGQLGNLLSTFTNDCLKLYLYQLGSRGGGGSDHNELVKNLQGTIEDHESQKKRLQEEMNDHKKNVTSLEKEIANLKKINAEMGNASKEATHLKAINKKLEDELKKTHQDLAIFKMKKKKCCG